VGDLDGLFTLNEVGAMIWQLIDGQKTGRQLAEAVKDEYDVEAEDDVVDFLQSLEDAGLIRHSEATQK
jgi:hypothetical protein